MSWGSLSRTLGLSRIPARCREEGQLPLYSQTPHHQTLIFTCCAQSWPSERMTREFYPPTKHPLHQTTPPPMTMLGLELRGKFNFVKLCLTKQLVKNINRRKVLQCHQYVGSSGWKRRFGAWKKYPRTSRDQPLGGQCFNHLYLFIPYWAAYTIKLVRKKCEKVCDRHWNCGSSIPEYLLHLVKLRTQHLPHLGTWDKCKLSKEAWRTIKV